MKTVSMAHTVDEKVEMGKPFTDARDPDKLPDYPSGLQIYLSFEDLQKLGFAKDGLEGGTRCVGTFAAVVTDGGGTFANGMLKRRASIQITDLGLEKAPEQNKADVMFPGPQT